MSVSDSICINFYNMGMKDISKVIMGDQVMVVVFRLCDRSSGGDEEYFQIDYG